MHAQVAGTAEYLAENDADGIRLAREIFEHLNWKEQIKPVDVTYKTSLRYRGTVGCYSK